MATNPDPTGPSMDGDLPATGSVAALISKATGVEPYFVGKPNPLMMRAALNRLQAHSETTVMIGDRMDTDVVAGLGAGMRTVLVLTGITRGPDVDRFPFRPSRVVDSIAGGVGGRARGRLPGPAGEDPMAHAGGPPTWANRRGGVPPAETSPVVDRNRRRLWQ